MKKFVILLAVSLMSVCGASAQSWGDLLKGVIGGDAAGAVSGAVDALLGTGFSTKSVVGNWEYQEAAVSLVSDNLLSQAGGMVASGTLAEKIDGVLSKAGIKAGAFQMNFTEDGKFTTKVGTRTLNGKYTVNEQNKTVQLSFNIVAGITATNFTASVEMNGSEMSLLFNADKLLQIVKAISGYTNNATLSTISTLASAYDGVKLGFKMVKK